MCYGFVTTFVYVCSIFHWFVGCSVVDWFVGWLVGLLSIVVKTCGCCYSVVVVTVTKSYTIFYYCLFIIIFNNYCLCVTVVCVL